MSRGWVIEVCRTCDRRATWPFCEHRDQPPPAGATSWCVSVPVVPARRADRYPGPGAQPANTAPPPGEPPAPPRGPSGVSAKADGTR